MKRLTFAFVIAGLVISGGRLASQQIARPSTPVSVSHYEEAKLSKPTYQIRREANVRVPMRDGVTLSTDIYRPDGPGPFPANTTAPRRPGAAGLIASGSMRLSRSYISKNGIWNSYR